MVASLSPGLRKQLSEAVTVVVGVGVGVRLEMAGVIVMIAEVGVVVTGGVDTEGDSDVGGDGEEMTHSTTGVANRFVLAGSPTSL